MKKDSLRKVPLKNYAIAFLVLLGIVIVTFYIKKVYELSVENKLSQSVLSRLVGEVKYDEVENVLLEKTSDYFIYISYTSNKDTYNLENELKDIISKYEIEANFYYLNVTNDLEETNFIANLNTKLGSNIGSINSLPVILYYQNNTLKDYISSYNDLFNISDFEALLINNGYQEK